MTTVDPDLYYQVGGKMINASVVLETDLRDLNTKLKVIRSAGTYPYGGPQWAMSYDQSASDAFEVGSLGVRASRELGNHIHLSGRNLQETENESHPGSAVPVPTAPVGSTLVRNLHPTEMSVGGPGGTPDNWDLISEYVTRRWADCDEGRIANAGTHLNDYGIKKSQFAATLYAEVVAIFTETLQAEDEILAHFVDEVANVCRAIDGSANAATYLATACTAVASIAKTAKDDCETSLTLLRYIVLSYEIDKAAARFLPWGGRIRRQLDTMIESNKKIYAAAIDARLGNIETKVTEAVQSNSGIYAMVSADVKYLSSILDRIPRNTDPIRYRDENQNKAAGAEGEKRAGVNPNAYKRKITVIDAHGNEQGSFPDRIDDTNRQVTEVKNTNEVKPDKEQIKIETQWARENGYTMTLVVDHRTKINDPEIQALIDSGQIHLIRKELDDNTH